MGIFFLLNIHHVVQSVAVYKEEKGGESSVGPRSEVVSESF